MNKRKWLKSALTAGILMGMLPLTNNAMASHHFEAAAVIKNPALAQLDNYVFQSSRPDHTAVIMTLNYAPTKAVGGVFMPGALYNIHIANDADFSKGHTFSLQFKEDNSFTLYDLDAPNGAVGTMGKAIGQGMMNQASAMTDGIQAWAGVATDPFYGNSPALHVYRTQLNAGQQYDPGLWTSSKGNNIFAGRNSAAIVLDIPNKLLGKEVKVFMTTAVKEQDKWQQVQYSANPLFSHVMLFESDALKTLHDASRPDKDDGIKQFASARTARASALAHSQKDPIAYGDIVANMLTPDVLTYQVGSKADYTGKVRNGRALDDDAMSTMLGLLIGQPTNQGIANPKAHTQSFPYVIPAVLK
ncbi:DUF4331 domain-containing protein [Aeromonas sp. BIGb0445]|uniref:DUF4331 domain-containing protein n=1 Tax=Aeromonas sp. BIGb0445 TaxID=2940593 RepID=UPI0021696195|nr:DUF4331 domain-containing protein [Aeromonas sp. BIGb0445]MCS3458930.1 hypothetical protein [Aeromonas sp. BIGb0445]